MFLDLNYDNVFLVIEDIQRELNDTTYYLMITINQFTSLKFYKTVTFDFGHYINRPSFFLTQ